MATRKKFDLDATRIKIIELLLRHQPYDLSFSKISRFTGVPRSTLYYYFGSDFKKLIDDVVMFGITKFTQIETIEDYKNFSTWEEFQRTRLKNGVDLIKTYPWAPLLFMRYRMDSGELGESIRLIEKKFLRAHKKVWKYFKNSDPKPANERLLASLKVGFLWGVSNSLPPHTNKNLIEDNEDEIIKKFTSFLADMS